MNRMHPNMDTLLDILCDRMPAFLPEADAIAVIHLAEQQHVLPFVIDRLRVRAPTLSDSLQRRLTSMERDNHQAAFWWTSVLKEVLAAFAAEGIAVVPLKGPFLAERLYGGAHLRSSRDLDLLVRREGFAFAQDLLARLGFTLIQEDNGYHELWTRGSTAIELHYDVADVSMFDFHVDAAWPSTAQSDFSNQPVFVLSPQDELLFLCLHGTKHCFEHLGHVLDIALFLDRIDMDGSISQAAALTRPEVRPLLGVLVLGCNLAQRLRPGRPLPFEISLPRRRSVALETFAGKCWEQLVAQPPTPMRWIAVRRFYRGTELTCSGHFVRLFRDLRDAFLLHIEADIEFSARFGVYRERIWLILILRYLRLLLKYMRGSPNQ